jgi:hypothetical protein
MPSDPTALSCRIIRVDSHSVTPTATACPGDDLILLLEIPPADVRRILTVEILRGSECRSVWQRALDPSAEKVILTYQLSWRDRPDASRRLTCRVALDGRLVPSPSVLLTPAADAQGRLDTPAPIAMSDDTRLAYTEAFARLLGRGPENHGPSCVPSEDGD